MKYFEMNCSHLSLNLICSVFSQRCNFSFFNIIFRCCKVPHFFRIYSQIENLEMVFVEQWDLG